MLQADHRGDNVHRHAMQTDIDLDIDNPMLAMPAAESNNLRYAP